MILVAIWKLLILRAFVEAISFQLFYVWQLKLTMECSQDLTSQALLERRRINWKIDRMCQEERMRKIITELSREMVAWKRQWLNLVGTNEQYKREDTVEELKGLSTYYWSHWKYGDRTWQFFLEVPLIESKIQCNMILAWILKFWKLCEDNCFYS